MPQHFRFGVLYAKDGQTSEQGTRHSALILFPVTCARRIINRFLSLVLCTEFYDNRMAAPLPLFTLVVSLFADDDLLSTVPQLWGAPPSSTSWTSWAIASASRGGGVIGPDSTSRVR